MIKVTIEKTYVEKESVTRTKLIKTIRMFGIPIHRLVVNEDFYFDEDNKSNKIGFIKNNN